MYILEGLCGNPTPEKLVSIRSYTWSRGRSHRHEMRISSLCPQICMQLIGMAIILSQFLRVEVVICCLLYSEVAVAGTNRLGSLQEQPTLCQEIVGNNRDLASCSNNT